MNLVKRAVISGAGLSLSDFDRVLDMQFGGTPSFTGKFVSQTTALAVSTLWSAVLVRSQDFAGCPWLTYRRTGELSKERASDHYLWQLLQHTANPEMPSHRFKRLMQLWVDLWGNAYAEIEISGRGQVTALWPWRPDRVQISRTSENGELQYSYKMNTGEKVTVPGSRILHVRGMSLDGVVGLSPIDYHKQTIGLSQAITEHGARFFSNGARPLGVLSHPNSLSDKAYERLKKDWAEQHQGLDNAHRIAILEEGTKWMEVGLNMVDAHYIEAQGLTQEDIARIYNVPQHRLGLLDRSTNSNITQQSLEYVIYSLLPICSEWQSEIHFSLLSEREAESITTGHTYLHLLRGDWESLSKVIATLKQWGIFSTDSIRAMFFDENPLPDGLGEATWRPVNMQPDDGSVASPNQPQAPAMDIVQPKPKPQPKPNGVAH